MRDDRPSTTAAYVAVFRGLSEMLPEEARLAHDPFGLRFGGRAVIAVARAARWLPATASRALSTAGPLSGLMAWIQVRTRVLDEVLLRFAARGGQQVLLLGAGFDCRAARFSSELAGVTVFEVDHPATQARKRQVLAGIDAPSARVAYLPWDFERQPMAELPARLADLGHDPGRPTLTLWEGVTMYLTEPAIEASLAALRALSAPGSTLALTYVDPTDLNRHVPMKMLHLRVLARHEPLRFGLVPGAVPGWLRARGFSVKRDDSADALMGALMPPDIARRAKRFALEHIVVADRADT